MAFRVFLLLCCTCSITAYKSAEQSEVVPEKDAPVEHNAPGGLQTSIVSVAVGGNVESLGEMSINSNFEEETQIVGVKQLAASRECKEVVSDLGDKFATADECAEVALFDGEKSVKCGNTIMFSESMKHCKCCKKGDDGSGMANAQWNVYELFEDGPQPTPAPPAGPDPPAPGDVKCDPCGTNDQVTEEEASLMLDLHNKMRAAVGTGALSWNCALMCQAQKWSDRCKRGHSDCYNLPIKAGENWASGTDMATAAWMWFAEHGHTNPSQAPSSSAGNGGTIGHYTAMVWKSTTELGCGLCRSAGGIFCQYAASAPNFGGPSQYQDNVPAFDGTAGKYEAAGISRTEAEGWFTKFGGWGFSDATKAKNRLR